MRETREIRTAKAALDRRLERLVMVRDRLNAEIEALSKSIAALDGFGTPIERESPG